MPAGQHTVAELIAGIASALLALVGVLDEKGVVQLEEYRATLHRLWDEIPEENAGSGTGFVFEKLIDLLNLAVAQRKQ